MASPASLHLGLGGITRAKQVCVADETVKLAYFDSRLSQTAEPNEGDLDHLEYNLRIITVLPFIKTCPEPWMQLEL